MATKPNYLKIYEYLRQRILSGQYAYQTKLPSKRALAADFDVSVITTEHAYELLEEEGYIISKPRSGYFVIYRDQTLFGNTDVTQITTIEDGPKNMPVNTEEAIPFPAYAKAYRKALTEQGENLFKTCPNQGLYELRYEIASYLLRNRGMQVDPSQIFIGSGAESLYGMIIQMLGRSEIYGLEDPCYDRIPKVYHANGAETRALPMGPDGIKGEALRQTDATVLHVTPYQSYPSGITASASKRQEYIHWVQSSEKPRMIIEDDFNSEFTLLRKAEDTLFSLEPLQHVFYMNTFSLTISRAMRVGYLIFPKERKEQLYGRISFYACSVPVIDQYVLAELLRNGSFERHINKVRRSLRKKD